MNIKALLRRQAQEMEDFEEAMNPRKTVVKVPDRSL